MNSNVDISIITVSYNVKNFLHQCLLSIGKATNNISAEIFVVDNNSIDGTCEFVRSEFPNVKLISNKENLGFGKANNLALKKAQGKYTLFLNPDTIIQEDTLEVMFDYLEKNSQVGLAGCKILNADGTLQLASRRSFPSPLTAMPKLLGLSKLFPKNKFFGKYNLTYLDPNESYNVDAVSGSFMFARTDLLQELGGFDETFFMYGEDLDLCYRIKEKKYEVHFVAETKIIHYKGESSKNVPFDSILNFYKAMDIFVKKHFSTGYFLLTTLLLRLGIFSHLFARFFGKFLNRIKTPVLDLIFIYLSFIFAILIRFNDVKWFFDYQPVILLYALIYLVSATIFGLHKKKKIDFIRAFGAIIIGGLINGSFTFFMPFIAYSRIVFSISFLFILFFLPFWRIIYYLIVYKKVQNKSYTNRTVIVGAGKEGQRIAKIITSKPELGYLFLGFIDNDFKNPQTISTINNLIELIKIKKIENIIFSSDKFTSEDIMRLMDKIQDLSVNIKIVPENINLIYGKMHIEKLDDISIVDVDYNIYKVVPKFTKRVFDIVLGLFLLLFFPIIYIIKVFLRYKTTNIKIGNYILKEWQSSDGKSIKLFWYPMLFAVIFGKISFVGDFIKLPENVNQRFYKPGITGLMQIEDLQKITLKEHQNYINYYMRNYSMMLDIEIIFKGMIR
ncbi:MAG: glycosyltransferase [Candidatus Marinimicrobia bacterium]|nr:glycosyltransferase [Candidatus Neomarinimicrobiota bacterium]